MIIRSISHLQLSLTAQEWDQVKTLEQILEPFHLATKKLQEENLVPSQFMAEWKRLLRNLSLKHDTLSKLIMESMEKREQLLMGNPIFLAGVFVDPYYRCLLSPEQKIEARNALYNLCKKINRPRTSDHNQLEVTVDESLDTSSDMSLTDYSDFEKYLDKEAKSMRKLTQDKTLKPSQFDIDFEAAMTSVEKIDRPSKRKLWDAVEAYSPFIQEAVRIAAALPPTQVSVERLFSSLKIFKNDLRTCLKEDIIEAMLFLKTNKF